MLVILWIVIAQLVFGTARIYKILVESVYGMCSLTLRWLKRYM